MRASSRPDPALTGPLEHSSWLIQRLDAPHPPRMVDGLPVDNPFAFGGGFKNGGLSNEAMGLLRGIFSFDYMGAAEFEFGAVPEALRAIAFVSEKSALAAFSFDLRPSDVDKGWDWTKGQPHILNRPTVYVLCRKGTEAEVEQRIRAFALDEGKVRIKESTRLSEAMRADAVRSPYLRVLGWLEIDNGFFFFVDREMWSSTARLFGVEV